ncbi:hypothetical protein EMPS_08457 [Entomortierella parvispora]|uniref:Uncharacterized protein n=1 Tax=Entomortierella parvispora TaxID=205924 RepID=A0A9P3HGQ4_9FUNG|nr:hypothetical protein EMPS_08457 [Entomortierella parvispora]
MSSKPALWTPEPTPQPEDNSIKARLRTKVPVSSPASSSCTSGILLKDERKGVVERTPPPEDSSDRGKTRGHTVLKASKSASGPLVAPKEEKKAPTITVKAKSAVTKAPLAQEVDHEYSSSSSDDAEETTPSKVPAQEESSSASDDEGPSSSLVIRRQGNITYPLNPGYEAFTEDGRPPCQGYAKTAGRQCLKGIDCSWHPEANRAPNALPSSRVATSDENLGALSLRTESGYEAFTADGRPRCQGYAKTAGRQCLKGIDCTWHPEANRKANTLPSSRLATSDENLGAVSLRTESGYEAFTADGRPRCQGYAKTAGRQCLKGIDCTWHPEANGKAKALPSSRIATSDENLGTLALRTQSGYEAFTADGRPRCQGYAKTAGRQCLKGIDCTWHPEANGKAKALPSSRIATSDENLGALSLRTQSGYEAFTVDGRPRCQGYAKTAGRQCLKGIDCTWHPEANRKAIALPSSRIATDDENLGTLSLRAESGYEAFTADGRPRCQGYAKTAGRQCLKGIDCTWHPEANRKASALFSSRTAVSSGNLAVMLSLRNESVYEALTSDGQPRCQGYARTKGRQCLFPAARCPHH